ncbi:ATP-binding protein [Bacillus sp. T33-2]|uniref:ATP-binding protein n=1 Tax=Bacillus sp. T33-2 TaxID=2054168 RepID=UPI000C75B584|nr:ATP-binding protein [Bacillus sp. T33-2]PLR96060.1 two-component sensor histidine kinase [Bacillus sp. T33-2]
MKDVNQTSILMFEEVKAMKFFLWVFYIVLILYDLVYYFIFPMYAKGYIDFLDDGWIFWFHLLLFLLLPLAAHFFKAGKPHVIKYMYLIGYLVGDFLVYIVTYWATRDKDFYGGHVLEVYLIFFSPIFVNYRFFWVLTIGLLLKYLFFGVFVQTVTVLFPIGLIIFFSFISWILLNRFHSYIQGITSVYEDLRQKEKFAVIGQMATAIGHEIRNPLSSLKGFTQLEQEKHPEDKENYSIMLNEIDRINSIASDLLVLGKPATVKKQNKNIKAILIYVESVVRPQAEREGVNIHLHIEENIPEMICDENQIKQVFINLLKNAIESMPGGGNITVNAHHYDANVTVNVGDEGCGIPKDTLEKLGEPFFTTKNTGTGLGLMVTKKIIDEHRGTIFIESEIGKGTIVKLTLPTEPNNSNVL